MTDLTAQIARLSPEKRALLEKLLKKEGVELGRARILPLGRDTNAFPLSFAQQRLWFFDQLEPGSPLYNIPQAVRLSGPLQVAALQAALREIVGRHETLRTTFVTRDGQPVQIIQPPLPLALPVLDLSDCPAIECEAEALRLAQAEARQPFDLQRGPLLRTTLLRLAEAEHILLLTLHHIIADGWSMGVLVRELALLYDAFTHHRPSPLPELPVQYVDFAVWQRDYLRGEPLARQLSYWKGRLGDLPPPLDLPTDRPRSALGGARGAHQSFSLSAALTDRLRSLARSEDATLFMTLLAAFQTLLFRYTGQEDISVGSPVANRNRAEIEPLIGVFINTLVLRADLSGQPTFRELLRRVRTMTLGAYENQDLPFEHLVEALHPDRSLSRTPLFQVMFILQNAPSAGISPAGSGLRLTPIETHSGTATFELTLSLTETPSGLYGALEYNADLFEAATIERLLAHFRNLLEGLVAVPHEVIGRLPLLTEEERRLLAAWNATDRAFPEAGLCLHQLFEAQAARTPQALAAVEPAQAGRPRRTLTYAELNARSDRLAQHLRQLGAGPATVVGLALERSLEMLVGLLAILKAGAAYVPLDPAYPAERLKFMLEDSGVRLLLTTSGLAARLPVASTQTVCLDEDLESVSSSATGTQPATADPDSLAYVIYTSGSTGVPKGVAVPHRAVVNHNLAMAEMFGLTPADRVLQFATINFDAAVEEIFPTWQRGGAVVLRPAGALIGGAELLALVEAEDLTVLDLPTAYWQAWVSDLQTLVRPLPASLRLVIVGGEAASVEKLAAWRQLAGDRVRWLNTYGPTETTIVSTAYEPAPSLELKSHPPIGRPIANVRAYVLDAYGQPAPIGVPGELYLGGAGLARGYWNRPELTAERFQISDIRYQIADWAAPSAIRQPPLPNPQPRLYKTGDRARWLVDGNLEYLGRADQQVKVRGYRIEPGEIEAALQRHPAVQQAVVTAWGEGTTRKLVAYFVSVPDFEAPRPAELKDFLQSKLPEYMLPAAFVPLAQLPLTPSGKINRRALPAPEGADLLPSGEYVAPRTPTEAQLAELWAELLNVSRVGALDHYFDLGGHSLLATQLSARVRQVFGVELPLRAVFERPTLAGLAEQIDRAQRGVALPPIELASRPLTEAALSFAQQRLWFIDQFEPHSAQYNLPDVVRLRGTLEVEALTQALNDVIARHEILRTTFQNVEGRALPRVAPALTLSVPVVDLTDLPNSEGEAEALRLAEVEARRPFDLSRGPLVRATLLKLRADDHLALLTLHHIVSDGWSSGVLTRELAALYAAFVAGRPSPLPPLALQYADYAVWQRGWLTGEVLQAQLEYWKRTLGEAAPPLNLPTDRPRPAVQTNRGALQTFTLDAELTSALKALSRSEGATLFMTLLTAFQALLHRYTGQAIIHVGTPVANRPRAELEDLIGFFVNTLVLRGDFSGGPTFREALRRVREAALGAFAHQDLPFEKLVDALQPRRDLSQAPLFQVMFLFQTARPRQAIHLPGLTLEPQVVHMGTSNFDLTLALEQTGETLSGAVEYNTDLFEAATIARLVGHYRTLLVALAGHADQPVAALPLLDEAERRQLLFEWNATATDFPDDLCVHHLFEQQAARTPDATALIAGAHSLTYAELNRRADQLAQHLRALGVGAEDVVGLAVDRSLELAVGVLGILKAGGAYVPLDPAYPAARLAFMIEDSGARFILTQSQLATRLPQSSAPVIVLDGNWGSRVSDVQGTGGTGQGTRDGQQSSALSHQSSAIGDQPATPHAHPSPDSLAYVIYTSGSTGQPKGVMVTHANVVNHNLAVQQAFALTAADRVLQFATINFDTAVEEIFPTWASGAALVLRPPGPPPSGAELHQLIGEHGLTVLDLPTAYWHAWVAEMELTGARPPESLRLVVVGGEAALAERLATWQRLVGDRVRWLNTYGPTEGTIIAALYEARGDESAARPVPIGRPIANAQLYVLDAQRQPAPIGVPGELYIGGAGVARGYLSRPELTAERFLSSDFGFLIADLEAQSGITNHNYRIYKTGDLARWRADGLVEYLGRGDEQVKVRGFRVELGEIESALLAHSAVREAAVVALGDAEKRLAAAIVWADPTHAPGLGELAGFLKSRLPDYMLPATFAALEALPLLPNAKVDRKTVATLLTASFTEGRARAAYQPPRTPAEETLAGLVAQVLRLKQVGVDDNFFELGGDSILSLQLVARAVQAGLRLTPRLVFEHPTVAALAAVAEAAPAKSVEAEQGTVTGPLPLTAIQRWFFEQNFADPHHWNQAVLLSVRQPLNREALHGALVDLLAHHDALRLHFNPQTQGVPEAYLAVPDAAAPLTWTDLSGMSAEEQSRSIERLSAEAQASLNLETGPLLRVVYFDCGAARAARLLVVLHHLVVDGVSWRILLEDLPAAYRQRLLGAPAALPPKTTSVKAWAEKSSEAARAGQWDADLAYWVSQAPSRSGSLPTDFPAGANTVDSEHNVTVSLSEAETGALLHDLPRLYHTDINDALLTALARSLIGWTGGAVAWFELEGHGREVALPGVDVSRTLGWFTSVHPVRLELRLGLAPGDALKSVKEQLRRIPNRGLSYGLLRYLAGAPELRALPVPLVSFNYLGQFGRGATATEPDLFEAAPEWPGPTHSGRARRSHWLDINGSLAAGSLQFAWTFSPQLHRRETVERVAGDFVAALRELAEHSRSSQAGGHTPSDFKHVRLDQRKLNKVLAQVGQKGTTKR